MSDVARKARLLIRVADIDSAYRGSYLRRAEAILAAELPPTEYRRLVALRGRLDEIGRQAERDADLGYWDKVSAGAASAETLREQIARREEVLDLGDAIYHASPVALSPFAAALHGLTTHPIGDLERLRRQVIDDLTELETLDAAARELYADRRRHFAELRIAEQTVAGELARGDAEDLKPALRGAIHAREWRRAEQLARALATQSQQGRVLGRSIDPAHLPRLGAAWPAAAVEAGSHLGLHAVNVPEVDAVTSYLCAECASHPRLPERDLSPGEPRPAARTCGHQSPPEIAPELRETLDLLMLHPFINSAGVRYLPLSVPEAMLVETFPERDIARSSRLLEMLGLAERAGRSRIEIELALQDRGERVLEELRIDPREHALVCIPFDAYLRLAPALGWGKCELWTHFDGYQVAHQLNLRALVGGDIRYGGPADLCSVGRHYTEERIITRFAVVKRLRLLFEGATG